jgi:predicted aminopeptidase
MHAKAALALLALGLMGIGTTGCYLGHVAAGQLRLLHQRRPIVEVLADPSTPPDLRERLSVVPRVREFAVDLGLDVGGQYTSYVDWPGDRIVTTVVATRPGELDPAGWYFPVVGRVPYKGFFDSERARAEVERQRAQGRDVCEFAVPAYSTLGWFDDPVTGPMLRGAEGRAVETIVHEFVHATVFIRSDADFNEGVASFVGEEASVLFYSEADRPDDARRERRQVEDGRRIQAERLGLRRQVAELYGSTPPGPQREATRADLERGARQAIAALPLSSRGAAAAAAEMPLNDACLALSSTYAADVDGYDRTLRRLRGDLRAFVALLRTAASAPDPRAALLAP